MHANSGERRHASKSLLQDTSAHAEAASLMDCTSGKVISVTRAMETRFLKELTMEWGTEATVG